MEIFDGVRGGVRGKPTTPLPDPAARLGTFGDHLLDRGVEFVGVNPVLEF
jgi:hypothetical protein